MKKNDKKNNKAEVESNALTEETLLRISEDQSLFGIIEYPGPTPQCLQFLSPTSLKYLCSSKNVNDATRLWLLKLFHRNGLLGLVTEREFDLLHFNFSLLLDRYLSDNSDPGTVALKLNFQLNLALSFLGEEDRTRATEFARRSSSDILTNLGKDTYMSMCGVEYSNQINALINYNENLTESPFKSEMTHTPYFDFDEPSLETFLQRFLKSQPEELRLSMFNEIVSEVHSWLNRYHYLYKGYLVASQEVKTIYENKTIDVSVPMLVNDFGKDSFLPLAAIRQLENQMENKVFEKSEKGRQERIRALKEKETAEAAAAKEQLPVNEFEGLNAEQVEMIQKEMADLRLVLETEYLEKQEASVKPKKGKK